MPTSLDPQQYLSPTLIGGAASMLAQAPPMGKYPAFGMTMRFRVTVYALAAKNDLGHWSSCKGLKVNFVTTPVKEGAQYTSATYLPERVEYGKITLERAMCRSDSQKVVDWLQAVQTNWMTPGGTLKLNDMKITLFDAVGEEVMTWTLTGVCPVSWSCSPFSSKGTDIAVETLELQHEGFL
ncbi:MAG TPA: phage tail protein [Pseudonocardiaceae bacterium]|jgi:phage tail-like protein|nr:phage tail protein [Pseudonocardiaceae bacterium]